MKFASLVLLGLSSFVLQATARASEEAAEPPPSHDKPYVPHVGEQPVYGKKFHPDLPTSDYIFEVNPLLLVRRGFGAGFEVRGSDNLSFGADAEFESPGIASSGQATGSTQYIGVAPKVRIYPLGTMNGVFFGFKLSVGTYLHSVSSAGTTTDVTKWAVTPSAHFGYRITTFGGFTVSGFVGAGLNLPRPEFKQADLQSASVNDASANVVRSRINDQHGYFKPDFGVTLGAAF